MSTSLSEAPSDQLEQRVQETPQELAVPDTRRQYTQAQLLVTRAQSYARVMAESDRLPKVHYDSTVERKVYRAQPQSSIGAASAEHYA